MKSDHQMFYIAFVGVLAVFIAAPTMAQPTEAISLTAARLAPRGGGGGSGSTVTIISEERYVDKYWQVDPLSGASQSHIFLGGEKLATLNASGTLQFELTDNVGSPTIITDGNGAVIETMDYRPYGQQAVRTGTSATDYLFIGKEKDGESGLQYFGARYLDNNFGNFTSIDPLLTDAGQVALLASDPQQLNGYRYARNNPLTFTDPTGEKVELVTRSVNPLGAPAGAHAFVLITNNAQDASQLIDVPGVNDKTRITLGGYASLGSPFQDLGDLVKRANDHSDYDLPENDYISRSVITKPQQYSTQADFENKILSEFNSMPDALGAYSFLGNPRVSRQANSNNVTSALLLRAGISSDAIITTARPGLNSQLRGAPGLGTGLPPNQNQSITSKFFGIKNKLAGAISRGYRQFAKYVGVTN